MISYYGMTDVSGLMVLEKPRNNFLGGGLGNQREFSEKTAEEMDNFIKSTLNDRYNFVKQTLTDYKEAIELMVGELFEKEVIDGSRVRDIISEFEVKNNLPTRLVAREQLDN